MSIYARPQAAPSFQIGTKTKQNSSPKDTNPPGGGRIKFKVGTIEFLNEEEKKKFEELLNGLSDSQFVYVHGYASEEGEEKENYNLSHRRAAFIREQIEERYPKLRVAAIPIGEVAGDRETNRSAYVFSLNYDPWNPYQPEPQPQPTVKSSELSNISRTIPNPTGHRGEFMSYAHYSHELGSSAMPEAEWDGSDGNWTYSDRKNWTQRWQNACEAVTRRNLSGRLQPFQQVKDYYIWVQDQLIEMGHEIRWVWGALYLVDELQETYDEGPVRLGAAFEGTMRPLLEDLNVGIANFAITQFRRLLYGDLSATPLRGRAAYEFDRDFIREEQGRVAFPIYRQYEGTAALSNLNDMFNKNTAWYGIGGSIIADPIPTFSGLFESDLRDRNIRYGQQARIDIPTGMLYPELYAPDALSRDFGNRLGADWWSGPNGWQWNGVRESFENVNNKVMGRGVDYYR